MKKPTGKQLTLIILLLALLLRLPEFFISLAYDEIWTFSNFAPLGIGQLLFDLELPNNHPLNSILIKLVSFLPLPPEFIRLPNLLAGLGAIGIMGLLLKTRHGKVAAWFGMLFMAVNAPLIVYSMQARGYVLQLFWLLLYAYSMVSARRSERSGERCWLYYLLILFSALGAITTLPTSALYLAGITLILWDYHFWQIRPFKLSGMIGLAGVLALTYILLNLPDLLAARKWGEEISNSSGFICWLGKTFYQVLPLGILPFALAGLRHERKHLTGGAAALLLIFGSAFFTNGGGARVYLPLTVLAVFYAAIGVAEGYQKLSGNLRKLLVTAASILTAASCLWQLPSWRFPNYHPVLTAVSQLPPDILTIYPAGDSYPALWNSNGQTALFYANNLQNRSSQRKLLLINRNNVISGMDETYAEKNLPMPFPGQTGTIDRIPTSCYELEAISGDFPADRPVIAVLHLLFTDSTFKSWRKNIQELAQNKNDVLFLNGFFTGVRLPDQRMLWSGSWYFAPGALTGKNSEKLPEKLSGVITFYQVNPPSKP